MWSRATNQEAAQEPAMIEAGATHHNGNLGRFATRCARRRLTRDRQPVIQRKGLVRLRDINTSVRSRCKDARRKLIGSNVESPEYLT
jgi:hypothetical protein